MITHCLVSLLSWKTLRLHNENIEYQLAVVQQSYITNTSDKNNWYQKFIFWSDSSLLLGNKIYVPKNFTTIYYWVRLLEKLLVLNVLIWLPIMTVSSNPDIIFFKYLRQLYILNLVST